MALLAKNCESGTRITSCGPEEATSSQFLRNRPHGKASAPLAQTKCVCGLNALPGCRCLHLLPHNIAIINSDAGFPSAKVGMPYSRY
jgi:hypothetical protein